MRLAVGILALTVIGCSPKTESPQGAYDLADEARSEASRSNGRVDDLEAKIVALESEIEDLRGEIETEAAERSSDTANLESEIQSHAHY